MKNISCFLDCSNYRIVKVDYIGLVLCLCDTLGFVEKIGECILVRLVPEM